MKLTKIQLIPVILLFLLILLFKLTFRRQLSEIGDCINNGDADMKSLPSHCGCPNEIVHPNVTSCCRKHLLRMLSDFYVEIIKADLPVILFGGSIIGWYRNGKLIPYDRDWDVTLSPEVFDSQEFQDILTHLAGRGYCVWFRDKAWTKLWSSVVGVDMIKWSEKNGKIYVDKTEFEKSAFLPKQQSTLEGTDVFIPNNPKLYLDTYYGVGKWEKPLKCTKIEDRKCIE